ncbi:hypothetical protein [uncultured Sunxiuqinia sp.]|uniref:hypothetical protein n=1 Tax=uncultured Sunxiuqinia sp. TaxID=1573825 RepID=UPI0026044F0E|nr:hypothetical protein [uncultured Sunxiuqinia sp.]
MRRIVAKASKPDCGSDPKKRQIIDLDAHTFKILSIADASKEINIKALIEKSLRKKTKDLEDANLYTYLAKNDPDGQVYLNSKEQIAFEKEMGL